MQEQSQIQEISIVSHNILEELKVGVVTRQRLSLLEHYDLSKVTSQLIDKGPRFSPEQIWPLRQYFGKADLELACTLEREFKRFVALTLIRPGHVYAPSGPVDMYWHFLILHTEDYRDFCNQIWGAFQHHPRGSQYEDVQNATLSDNWNDINA